MHCYAPRTPAPLKAKAASSPLAVPARRLDTHRRPQGEHPAERPAGPSAGLSFAEVPVHARPAQATGPASLPEPLKTGVERLSGFAMDDVRVHRNSAEPAKLGALAYTQGTEIHLGPGQEQHLPHEAWHVVQQKQGRVTRGRDGDEAAPTEEPSLEAEANLASLQMARSSMPKRSNVELIQPRPSSHRAIQLKRGPGDKPKSKQTSKQKSEEKSLEDFVRVKVEPFHLEQTIPTAAFDITTSLVGSLAFEQKQVQNAAKALTKAEWEKARNSAGVKLDLTAGEFKRIVISVLKSSPFKSASQPKAGLFLQTSVGGVSVETELKSMPPGVETTVTPQNDIIFELGAGLRAVASVEYKLKATSKPGLKSPGVQAPVTSMPAVQVSPWAATWSFLGALGLTLLTLPQRTLQLFIPPKVMWDDGELSRIPEES